MLKVAAFIASRSLLTGGRKLQVIVNLIGQNDNSVIAVTEKLKPQMHTDKHG